MMNKQKAFVILTPGFAASENDSTCLPMQQKFVKAILKMHPDLHVFILSFQYPYYEKSYQWFEATVFSFNGRNRGGISRLLLRKKVNEVLKWIHNKKQIIGLLSFWLNECAAVGKRFGERNNISHYCWLLGQDARKENKYAEGLSIQSNELIALSDFLQDEFERNHGVRPFKIIPSAIEPKPFKKEHRKIDLLAVGSLIPLKQFEIFIETVADLKKEIPNIKAMIIGNGPEEQKLKQLALKLDLQKSIQFAGELSHAEVLSKMSRSKVLLHPSLYEGFSGVCLETLSMGAHVISFCRAMNRNTNHWHIVNDKEEMIRKAFSLLTQSLDHSAVTPFLMSDTVRTMMQLYYAQKTSVFNEFNKETAFSKTN